MSRRDEAQPEQEAPKKLGFFGKARLAVTSFVKGAIKSIPMSLAYSAVAFTASAVIGGQFGAGYDFLHTGDSTLGQLAVRMAGASMIGGVISGTVNSFQAVSAAGKAQEQPQVPASAEVRRGRGQAQSAYYDVSPQVTPAGNRFQGAQPRL